MQKIGVALIAALALGPYAAAQAQTFAQWEAFAEADRYDPNSPSAMFVAGIFDGVFWASLMPEGQVERSYMDVCVGGGNDAYAALPGVPLRISAVVEEGNKNRADPIQFVVLKVMRRWYPCSYR